MTIKSIVKTNEYHDSVSLMAVASKLSNSPGVLDAAVVMASESNKALLKQAGLLTPDVTSASPNDLAVVVSADEAVIDKLLIESDRLLRAVPKEGTVGPSEFQPRSIHAAYRSNPQANGAVISIADRYATDEAWKALRKGLHVHWGMKVIAIVCVFLGSWNAYQSWRFGSIVMNHIYLLVILYSAYVVFLTNSIIDVDQNQIKIIAPDGGVCPALE